MTSDQSHTLQDAFAKLASASRAAGISDQQMAEWVLGVGARWLVAHGVSKLNIHQWVDYELGRYMPVPLTAAARARNDFGGDRR